MKDRSDEDERDEGGSGGFGRRGARAYQAAVEAVFAIPVAGGLGYWADTRFETEPIFLLVGLGLGFAAFVMRILRMRRLVETGQDDESEREEQ